MYDTELSAACEHTELHPPRHPGALPVCVECGTAVLDFDAVYRILPNGNLTYDHDASECIVDGTVDGPTLWDCDCDECAQLQADAP